MGRRILIVEDHEDNRRILRDLLTSADFEVIEAEDGEAGVAAAAAHLPDLILMDIQLPVFDGYEATRRLKADPRLKAIPIIVVTSYALTGDSEKAKVAGYLLPFASPAHAHEFRVLERLPLDDDQYIVAGVVDTVTNVIEHPEVIADRLTRITAVVGDPRRVMAGTDCGFETIPGMSPVAEDVAWAKLAALVEGARLASRQLFP